MLIRKTNKEKGKKKKSGQFIIDNSEFVQIYKGLKYHA